MTNFTNAQLLKVNERLLICNNLNKKVGSPCKISNLKIYADELDNIYVYYVSETMVGDSSYQEFYIKFDKEGNEVVLNKNGFPPAELEEMFSKLKEINFNE